MHMRLSACLNRPMAWLHSNAGSKTCPRFLACPFSISISSSALLRIQDLCRKQGAAVPFRPTPDRMISSWLSSLWGPASKPPAASAPAPTALIQPPPSPPPVQQQETLPPAEKLPPHSMFTPRSYKQLSLFLAGAAFLGLTTAVTRRSVARKIKAAMPRYYNPSYLPDGVAPKVDSAEGTVFALEALSLATLNTFSFGIMATGGLAWAFDISSIEDLRARARKHQQTRKGEKDEEAEDTIEQWMASVLGKTEGEGKEERDAKEWMAKLLVKAKDKADGEEEKK